VIQCASSEARKATTGAMSSVWASRFSACMPSAISRPADWERRCTRIIARFNSAALDLFDADSRRRGLIEAEDRNGVRTSFPLTTLSVGALYVQPGAFHIPEDVASAAAAAAAAAAKHRAKRASAGLYVYAAESGWQITPDRHGPAGPEWAMTAS
jgi:hypothetical protein